MTSIHARSRTDVADVIATLSRCLMCTDERARASLADQQRDLEILTAMETLLPVSSALNAELIAERCRSDGRCHCQALCRCLCHQEGRPA